MGLSAPSTGSAQNVVSQQLPVSDRLCRSCLAVCRCGYMRRHSRPAERSCVILIAIITKSRLLVHWTRFGVNIQSTVFAPGMIDTRASILYADRCKTLQYEAPLQGLDLRTTRKADRLVDNVKKSKKLCLGLQTNLNPELVLASSAGKGFKGFYDHSTIFR